MYVYVHFCDEIFDSMVGKIVTNVENDGVAFIADPINYLSNCIFEIWNMEQDLKWHENISCHLCYSKLENTVITMHVL